MMAFYRAAGIAPLSLQYIDAAEPAIYTHNFPAYCDPDFQRWLSEQEPVAVVAPGTVVDSTKQVYLHFMKPTWNFRNPVDRYDEPSRPGRIFATRYQGDAADIARIADFLATGWARDRFESVFMSNRTLEPGLFFTDETASAMLVDSDSDGLNDPLDARSPGVRAFIQRPMLETTELLSELGIEPGPVAAGVDTVANEILFTVRVRPGTTFTHNVSGPDGLRIDNLSYEIVTGGTVEVHLRPP